MKRQTRYSPTQDGLSRARLERLSCPRINTPRGQGVMDLKISLFDIVNDFDGPAAPSFARGVGGAQTSR